MIEDLKHIEQIENYCEGTMSPEEKSAFEAQLIIDENLKEEFELYEKIVSSFKSSKEDAIRNKLKIIDNELDHPNDKKNISSKFNNYRIYFAIAASITIVIGLISYLQLFTSSKEKYIASYEIDEPGLPVLMGENSNVAFDDAMSAYKQNEFKSSFQIIQSLLKDKPGNDTLNYFAGIILSRMDKSGEAIPYMESVILNHSSLFHSKAMYNLGMVYWKVNDISKAVEIFKQISVDSNSPYAENARQILKHF